MTSKELREKRAPLSKRIKEMADESQKLANAKEPRGFNDEEQANWKALNDDYNELDRQIEQAEIVERGDKVEADQKVTIGDERIGRGDYDGRETANRERNTGTEVTDEHRALALQGWFRCANDHEPTEAQVDACRRVGVRPNAKGLNVSLPSTSTVRRLQDTFRGGNAAGMQARALSAFTGADGGVTVPEGFVNQLEINRLAFGGMLQVADIMRTADGGPLPWPTASDTGNTGAMLGESKEVATTDQPTFNTIILHAYKFTSNAILVPSELFQDSAFDMASTLGAMLGERLGRITNTYFTTGTGASQPKGITIATSAGKTAAAIDEIEFSELTELIHAVDPAYRGNGNSRFMFHDDVLLHLRLKLDGDGRPVWQEGTTGGEPSTILTYPYTINQDMATLGTGNITVIFGDMSKYKIRQVAGVRLYRLEERYREFDQDGFMAFSREDADLLDAGTDPVTHLVQA